MDRAAVEAFERVAVGSIPPAPQPIHHVANEMLRLSGAVASLVAYVKSLERPRLWLHGASVVLLAVIAVELALIIHKMPGPP